MQTRKTKLLQKITVVSGEKEAILMNTQKKTETLAMTALFAAMIFVATYWLKVPIPTGYVHMGDTMIFTAVIVLGRNKAALAGGVGAAMADLLGGYAVWAIPSFVLKALMALIMGICIEKSVFKLSGRKLWIVAAVLGGTVEVIGYILCTIVLYGWAAAAVEAAGTVIQCAVGIMIAFVLCEMIQKSPLKSNLVYTTYGGKLKKGNE